MDAVGKGSVRRRVFCRNAANLLYTESMKHVLITGFPGFIAGQLIERLAPTVERFSLLVEGRFAAKAEAEAARIVPGRFETVIGDITLKDVGLTKENAARLRREVDTVYHLAAVYDLAVSSELAERINVVGTENVNDFVRSLARLERYNYISTYAVSGKRTGVIREGELEHDTGFHNHYEETKYRAEIAVRRLISEGLPVSIFRPGVVVGSSRDGRTVKFDGPYMLLKVLRKLPPSLSRLNVGSKTVRFQMVPVDFIVAALATLGAKTGAAGKTFHLTDPEPCTTAEIFDLFSEALFHHRSWMRVPQTLTSIVTESGLAEPLGLQRQAGPYFFHEARWDCMNTLDALDGTGIEVPRLETYVDKLVSFFLEHEHEMA